MKTFKQFLEEKDPCWTGYRQLGTKKKNGKEVPNCIPIKEEKDTKQEANYQDSPKGDEYCEDCTMWREPNGCTAVEGKISPKGWCSYFEEKEEDDDEDEKEEIDESIEVGDGFILELKNIDIETTVIEIEEDGVILSIDEYAATRLEEAEYQGKDVALNKPMAGDVKKSKVFVKGPSGRVVKVNFGDKNMTIKKHIPERRKSFRARHNCDTPGPKHRARYWSCRAW